MAQKYSLILIGLCLLFACANDATKNRSISEQVIPLGSTFPLGENPNDPPPDPDSVQPDPSPSPSPTPTPTPTPSPSPTPTPTPSHSPTPTPTPSPTPTPPVTGGNGFISNPVLFVTQVPIPDGFTSVVSPFGNHLSNTSKTGRGGDLWILYPNGTLKNLTQTAGFGNAGVQGAGSIAVRNPKVHWSASKAVFSMVVGVNNSSVWQLYEITGLGINDTPVISKVPNQPSNYNNVFPAYTSDNDILFVSDRPLNGNPAIYPLLDEYEKTKSNTGLWKLNPATSNLTLLDHSPSGNFHPLVASDGRIIFTRWDHLHRDKEIFALQAFNWSDETATATQSPFDHQFPVYSIDADPQAAAYKSLGYNKVDYNHFFLWQMNQDGTESETLNHIGRHELKGYIPSARFDDPNLPEFFGQYSTGANVNKLLEDGSMLQPSEVPSIPGIFLAVTAPEFGTHGSGQIFYITGQAGLAGDLMQVTYLTHPDTSMKPIAMGANVPAGFSGRYRNPLALKNGTLISSYANYPYTEKNGGVSGTVSSGFDFRLRTLKTGANSYLIADQALTPGIVKSVTFPSGSNQASYNGPLWELDPAELVALPVPPKTTKPSLPSPEASIFAQAGVNLQQLESFLTANNLALIVSRNVTHRDDADKQQPYNLRVKNTATQTLGAPTGKIYDITDLQIFQGDHVRGYASGSFQTGRAILPRFLHDPKAVAENLPNPTGPAGSVKIASDGSFAAFVPAGRALTWQLINGKNSPGNEIVAERVWVTFQAGEVRVCAACHGVNSKDQAGNVGIPTNPPQALKDLLIHWKSNHP